MAAWYPLYCAFRGISAHSSVRLRVWLDRFDPRLAFVRVVPVQIVRG